MALYYVQETYLYEIEADTPEQARELYQQWAEDNETDAISCEFKDNFLDIYDQKGNEH